MDKIKSGYITIIGKPNAGKSTLMNALLGEKLSITTDKPQTTRKKILGILSEPGYQIIFLDTPGILRPEYALQRKMTEYIKLSVKDADLLLFMIDISEDSTGSETLSDEDVKNVLSITKTPKILVINKIDLSEQKVVMSLISNLSRGELFDKIIPISALNNYNLDNLLDSILEYLPEHPKYYPDDQLSDENERFFVSEIIREKIFEYYREEIPYSTEVVIEEFREKEGRKDFISAVIYVERDSQKPIIVGKNGEAIKAVGRIARESIEEFLARPVYLEIRVKVKRKWRNDPEQLRRFGYFPDEESR